MLTIREFVNQEIHFLANGLIERLLRVDADWYEFTEGMYKTDPENEDQYIEIFQYFVVSGYLYEQLEELGEPVTKYEEMYIWGRTCCGISLDYDSVIKEIYKKRYPEENPA